MAEQMVLAIIFGLGVYFFFCFVQFKICEKFGIGSLFECCIPIYNIVLLCRCADISGWNVLWIILPGAFFRGNQAGLASVVIIIFAVVLWGRIAERMGRSFWQYGLGSAFLGVPVLVLAFGSAHPSQGGNSRFGRRVNKYESEVSIYKPLPINDPIVAAPLVGGISSSGIYCRTGEFKGNTIPINTEGITIGRDPSRCQIVLSSKDASRTHVSVIPDRNDSRSVVVTDLNSTNGTFHQLPGSSPNSFRWERISGSITMRQ